MFQTKNKGLQIVSKLTGKETKLCIQISYTEHIHLPDDKKNLIKMATKEKKEEKICLKL